MPAPEGDQDQVDLGIDWQCQAVQAKWMVCHEVLPFREKEGKTTSPIWQLASAPVKSRPLLSALEDIPQFTASWLNDEGELGGKADPPWHGLLQDYLDGSRENQRLLPLVRNISLSAEP